MGSMCGLTQEESKRNPEILINLPSYSSSYEKPFESFNKEFNLLVRLPLYEYQLTLLNLPYSSQMRGPSSIYLDETDNDNCSVFFKNFIANHPIFYAKRDDNLNQIFVEFISNLLTYLRKGTKAFMKKKQKEFNSGVIKKYYLCIIGILFCYSSDKGKIDALFSLLANDNNCIEKNINNELLIYSMIFLATFSNYLTMKDMKKSYETLPITVDNNEVYAEAFGLEKIEALYLKFIDKLYGEGSQSEVSYDDYFNKIQTQELAWILTPQGIRSQLK